GVPSRATPCRRTALHVTPCQRVKKGSRGCHEIVICGGERAKRSAGREQSLVLARARVTVLAPEGLVGRVLVLRAAAYAATEPQQRYEPGPDQHSDRCAGQQVVDDRQADPHTDHEAQHHAEGQPGRIEAAAGGRGHGRASVLWGGWPSRVDRPTASIPQVTTAPTASYSVRDALRSPRLLTTEVLAGAVTTLALIPEVISFSVIAGVDPKVSLIASVVLAISMTFLGGRPAMITAAAGAVALVVAPLVHTHGVQYLLPTVLLAGLIQVVFGLVGLARIMRFIPRSVMIGFVNSLGILIFTAQLPHVFDVPTAVYPLFALTLVVVLVLPRFTTAVPAPLIAIVLVTAIAILGHLSVPTVGDQGAVAGGLPGITPLEVPLTLETLQLIAPTALSVAFV